MHSAGIVGGRGVWVACAIVLALGGCSRREPASRSAPPMQGSGDSASGGVLTTPPPPQQPPDPQQQQGSSQSQSGDTPNGGEGEQPTERAGSSSPEDDHTARGAGGSIAQGCTADRDCACGVERASGQCAVGLASRIDTSHQCPDFCSGLDGRGHPACERGRCVIAR